jgi:hypothetical protein
MDAMVKIEERKMKGKKMTNMKWDINLSQVLTTFYTVSPLVGRIFRAQVGGPNLRTFKYVFIFLLFQCSHGFQGIAGEARSLPAWNPSLQLRRSAGMGN